jgi:hypothetical protein
MKKLLAFLAFAALAIPAQAHFIWLVPQKDGTVQMVFSDSLDPDANVPISKVAHTTIAARSAGNKLTPKKTEAKDHFLFTFPSKPPIEVVGTCIYGIPSKKGDPYLLMYYAKTSALPEGWKAPPLAIYQTKPGLYQVLWNEKADPAIELTAVFPNEDSRELKRQPNGLFALGDIPAGTKGYIGLRAKYVEKKAGERDGKKYNEVRHYSTWTLPVPTQMKGK